MCLYNHTAVKSSVCPSHYDKMVLDSLYAHTKQCGGQFILLLLITCLGLENSYSKGWSPYNSIIEVLALTVSSLHQVTLSEDELRCTTAWSLFGLNVWL